MQIKPLLLAVIFYSPFAYGVTSHEIAVDELAVDETQQNALSGSELDQVMQYAQESLAQLQVPDVELSDLKLVDVKKSLLGHHYTFQQHKHGIEVEGGSFVVSYDHDQQKIFKKYFKLQKAEGKKIAPAISKEQALEVAWKAINGNGKILAEPQVKLVYAKDAQGKFQLAYRTMISTTAPYGAWLQHVDARLGKVLSQKDQRTTLHKKIEDTEIKQRIEAQRGKNSPFSAAMSEYRQIEMDKKNKSAGRKISGTALVFDPDPITMSLNIDFRDDSPFDLFEPLYKKVVLPEITERNGVYHLEGPWAKIIDFEDPRVAPATRQDRQWNAKRGDNGFNDVMTYYHIDQNQRYIQSLGFVGEKGIQNQPIEIDTNGNSGADNSQFDKYSNRLIFGHGCVDDNEDADVIIHEYAHALNHAINNQFMEGGDGGAMSEGWGDYWAGSYSLRKPNGDDPLVKNRVYNWDGAGCWGGRRLDVMGAVYYKERTYLAHENLPLSSGELYVSDELWSTPLYQSLLQAIEVGIPAQQIDKIILESQFGLGSGIKMHDWAKSIVLTAQKLYPVGVHADIFKKNFKHHQILQEPKAMLQSAKVEFVSANGSYIMPGDQVYGNLTLANKGDGVAKNLSVSATSGVAGITWIKNSLDIVSFEPTNAPVKLSESLLFQVGHQVPCGTNIPIKIDFNHDQQINPYGLESQIQVGKPVGVTQEDSNRQLFIPDGDETGVTSVIEVPEQSYLVTENFKVHINVLHTFINDLTITLISPSGKEVQLFGLGSAAGEGSRYMGTYPTTLTPLQSLNILLGEKLAGRWQLKLVDNSIDDQGQLISWGLVDINAFDCQNDSPIVQ